MMNKNKKSFSVPKDMHGYYTAIIELTDSFSAKYLDEEYAQLIREATAALCRKKPSPVQSGSIKTWACAIIHAIGMINFLYDKSTKPYISNQDLISYFSVGQSTASGKSKQIRELLKMRQLDHKWMLPSMINNSSVVWIMMVNGYAVDIRTMPYEVQEIAFQKGLIPYIPGQS